MQNLMSNDLLYALGEAVNTGRDGVNEYVEPLQMPYKKMLRYEQKELQARALLVLDALASFYGMTTEVMLAVLEQHRNEKRI